ncbi:MAG TPA: hypothetical protein VF862_12475 [Gemmatimonadales bacterium]
MDKQSIALLIPLFALTIPIIGIIASSVLKLQKSRMEMLKLQSQPDPGLLNELEELRNEVHLLRGELTEVHERLDFTERLLTAKSDRHQLPGG